MHGNSFTSTGTKDLSLHICGAWISWLSGGKDWLTLPTQNLTLILKQLAALEHLQQNLANLAPSLIRGHVQIMSMYVCSKPYLYARSTMSPKNIWSLACDWLRRREMEKERTERDKVVGCGQRPRAVVLQNSGLGMMTPLGSVFLSGKCLDCQPEHLGGNGVSGWRCS